MSPLLERLCSPAGRLGGVRGLARASVLALMTTGCATSAPTEHEIAYSQAMSPSVELATTPGEERALEQAASLPTEQPVQLAGQRVMAGPIYAAASGRRCRRMAFDAHERLACQDYVSDNWVFVPNIFSPQETLPATEPDAPREYRIEPAPQSTEAER